LKESVQGLTGGGNDKGVVDTVKDLAGGGSGEGQSFKDLSGMLSNQAYAFTNIISVILQAKARSLAVLAAALTQRLLNISLLTWQSKPIAVAASQ
jgi:hypothetical protein